MHAVINLFIDKAEKYCTKYVHLKSEMATLVILVFIEKVTIGSTLNILLKVCLTHTFNLLIK